MTKPYAEMNEDELLAEVTAWENVISAPRVNGSPNTAERNAAYLLKDTAAAWLFRRQMENKTEEPKS